MRCSQQVLTILTRGQGIWPITDAVHGVVKEARITAGLCTVFIQHTSASLLIQENADPTVRSDLLRFLQELVQEGPDYEHDAEGPDDMPAHIKAALLPTSLQVPILDGVLELGTWQGLYLVEHRRKEHHRKVIVQILGT